MGQAPLNGLQIRSTQSLDNLQQLATATQLSDARQQLQQMAVHAAREQSCRLGAPQPATTGLSDDNGRLGAALCTRGKRPSA